MNSIITEQRKSYNAVDYAKLIFAMGIVGIHSGLFWDFQYGFYLKTMLLRLGVPFFFFCSGYFLARKTTEENKREVCEKYIKKLAVPYFLLNIFYVPAAMIRGNYFDKQNIWSNSFLTLTWRSPTVMWFVGALMWCVLILFVIDNGTFKRALIAITAFIMLYVLGLSFNTYCFWLVKHQWVSHWLAGTFRTNSSAMLCGFLFFYIGYCLEKYGGAAPLWAFRTKTLLIAIICGFVCLFLEVKVVYAHIDTVQNYEYFLSHIVIIPALFVLLTKAGMNSKPKRITRLSRILSSYIYYTHIAICYFVDDIQSRKELLFLNKSVYKWGIIVLITVTVDCLYVFIKRMVKEHAEGCIKGKIKEIN